MPNNLKQLEGGLAEGLQAEYISAENSLVPPEGWWDCYRNQNDCQPRRAPTYFIKYRELDLNA